MVYTIGVFKEVKEVWSVVKGCGQLGGMVRWDRGVVSWEVWLGGIGVWSVGRYG